MKHGQHQYVTLTHEQDKLIVFERGDLLFIFNFHPSNVFPIKFNKVYIEL